jgi:hypothetical protein
MASDAAYSGGHFREAVHRAGFIPNCHPVSHGGRKSSIANAAGKNRAKLGIRYRENWHLNGHHELACARGQGEVLRRAKKNASGEAVGRLEGSCPNCDPISLTTGQWRLFNNKKAAAKALHDEQDKIDWRVGNPLTFNDP